MGNMKFSILSPLLLLGTVCACTSTPAPRPATVNPVLMLSIDGLRADALGKGNSPHLDALANDGVRAKGMQPSYPAVTFPNHYTLVTGRRPDKHGLVHNQMDDAELGRFELRFLDAVLTPAWWNDSQPIWVDARQSGLRTATFGYPGGETAIRGTRPDLYAPYDESVDSDTRVDTVLGWLAQEDTVHLVTTYFEYVDQAGHAFGPDSPQYQTAVRRVDTAVGRLVDGLKKNRQLDRVNLIIVSDHGMAEVPNGHAISVDSMVPATVATNVSTGQIVGFSPLPGQQAKAEEHLLGAHANYDCWKRENLPARWHYGTHRRVPPIICQMHEGWDAVSTLSLKHRQPGTRGSHGYDPALPSMQAVFIGHGPAFRQGVVMEAIQNVDVYPLMTRLLDIPGHEHDGNPAATDAALR